MGPVNDDGSFSEADDDGGIGVGVSEQVTIKDIMASWGFQMGTADSEAFLPNKSKEETEEAYLQRKMGITDEVLEELQMVSGPDSLGVDKIKEQNEWMITVPATSGLKTTQFLRLEERRKLRDRYQWGAQTMYPESRLFNHYRDLPVPADPKERVEAPEVVLTVTLLRCFKFRQKRHGDSYFMKIRSDIAYCVLSTQFLSELRDRFQCQIDYIAPGDFSEDPNTSKEIRNRDMYPSGCFFIEDTFYNDNRAAHSIDYSKPITEWAARKKLNEFKTADMAQTRFIDLNIKLGQPYVYIHQGNCEHLFLFSDARLLSLDDCWDRTKYPVIHNVLRPHRVPCRGCNTFTATWMTTRSRRDPEDPCFYCDKCLLSYHYDKQGKKIDDFVLHHFVDKTLEER